MNNKRLADALVGVENYYKDYPATTNYTSIVLFELRSKLKVLIQLRENWDEAVREDFKFQNTEYAEYAIGDIVNFIIEFADQYENKLSSK